MRTRSVLFSLFCAMSMMIHAQYTTVGRVIDELGNPISGAKIHGKGTSKYTESAIDGSFTLETPLPIKKVRVTAMGKAAKSKKCSSKNDNINIIQMEQLNWYNERQDEYRWFVLAQCGLLSKDSKDVPFGVMFGRAKKFGWYGKVMFSGLPSTEESIDDAYYYKGWGSSLPTYNDDWLIYHLRTDYKTGLFSAVAGGVARIKGPVYAYLGAGYVYRKIAIESYDLTSLDKKWYEIVNNAHGELNDVQSIEGVALDGGLMMNCQYVTLNLGYTVYGNDRFMGSIHFGIGYTF